MSSRNNAAWGRAVPPVDADRTLSVAEMIGSSPNIEKMWAGVDEIGIDEHASFAYGQFWFDAVRPSVFTSGCRFRYLHDIPVSGIYQASIFVGMLTAGRHAANVEGRSIATDRIGVPTLIALGEPMRFTTHFRAGQTCDMSGFFIEADGLAPLLDDLQLAPLPCCRCGLQFRQFERAERLRTALLDLAVNPYTGALGRLYAEARILAAVFEIATGLDGAQSACPTLSRLRREQAERAQAMLESALADPPTIGQIARDIGVNETTLRRSFKQVFGVTIIDYLRDRRLDVARTLLRENRLTVAQIAYRVGFASPANFATAYRRRFGHPPRAELRAP
jgi:AraC-like DNA-binding protein